MVQSNVSKGSEAKTDIFFLLLSTHTKSLHIKLSETANNKLHINSYNLTQKSE